MGNERVTRQQSRHDAPAPVVVAPVTPTDVMAALQRQVDALSARVDGQDLEEVNERAYKYKRIEEAEKIAEKGRGKRQVEDHRCQSPKPKRRSAFDRIRAPDRAYSRADLPRGSPFSHLQ
ncbi:hypothetical protein LIER_31954 [Lithospermum erythrorhizon]|uniref:Uncharacterized protein n=1 Tax=Lithospermum erythrorhizon TaxID=34254 RepID=A0AAV3RXV4_LITER